MEQIIVDFGTWFKIGTGLVALAICFIASGIACYCLPDVDEEYEREEEYRRREFND